MKKKRFPKGWDEKRVKQLLAALDVGDYNGSQSREVVVTPEQWETMKRSRQEAGV